MNKKPENLSNVNQDVTGKLIQLVIFGKSRGFLLMGERLEFHHEINAFSIFSFYVFPYKHKQREFSLETFVKVEQS